MRDSYLCSAAQDARGRSWVIVIPHWPMSDSYLYSAQDARGCSWMLVLSHGHMSDSYLCSAQDALSLPDLAGSQLTL